MHKPKARCFTSEHYPPKNKTLMRQDTKKTPLLGPYPLKNTQTTTIPHKGTQKQGHLDYIPQNSPFFIKTHGKNTQKQQKLDNVRIFTPGPRYFIISRPFFHRRKPNLVHIKILQSTKVFHHPATFYYTLQNCFTTPFWQRLVNNVWFFTQPQPRTHQLISTTLCKHRHQSQLLRPVPTAHCIRTHSEPRLWQATHYRQHPNIAFSPPFKELVFIDPEQPSCIQTQAADLKRFKICDCRINTGLCPLFSSSFEMFLSH